MPREGRFSQSRAGPNGPNGTVTTEDDLPSGSRQPHNVRAMASDQIDCPAFEE